MLLIILATFLIPFLAHAEDVVPCMPAVIATPEINQTPSDTPNNATPTVATSPSPRLPQRGELLITELLPVPPDGAQEWVEIKNETNETLQLTGVALVDGADHRVALGGSVEARRYSIINLTNAILNNTGERVALTLADGTVIDEMFYGDWNTTAPRAPKPTVSMSLSRFGNDFLVTTPTPNADNIAPPPPPPPVPAPSPESSVLSPQGRGTVIVSQPTSLPTPAVHGSVHFSELYPIPYQGEEEWLELWNTTQNAIAVEGWNIVDASGRTTPLHGTLLADNRLMIPSPRGALNNGGDEERLTDATNSEIDKVTYGADVKRGEAYAWDGTMWQRTTRPTPNGPNIILSPERDATSAALTIATPSDTQNTNILESSVVASSSKKIVARKKNATVNNVTLDEARALPTGSIVRTEGVISTPPGVFGNGVAYLDGMQIYFRAMKPPSLKLGDVVRIQGKVGANGGEARITASSIAILKSGDAPIPESVAPDEISDDTVGSLVETQGIVTQKMKNTLVLEGGGASLSVVLKSNALASTPPIGVGDTVKLRGIVSKTTNGLRLLPRFPDDFTIVEKAAPPPAPPRQSPFTVLIPLAALLAVILSGFVIRQYYLEKIKNHKEEKQKPAPFPV